MVGPGKQIQQIAGFRAVVGEGDAENVDGVSGSVSVGSIEAVIYLGPCRWLGGIPRRSLDASAEASGRRSSPTGPWLAFACDCIL